MFSLKLVRGKEKNKRRLKGVESMIQNIDISKIHPHLQNPRKDLGDITELAESIKAQGILQNLTVVPWNSANPGEGITGEIYENDYTAVIGHRRLAAAKLAGMTEVPCVVSDMDYKTQLEVMLLENMQRSDLTLWEQAQGFQMLLDVGESIGDISEKTGFSESTVRRRVKLLDLDGEKFKKSVERGATLMDYMELDKINDIELRNKVLDKIGTPNFNYELQAAIDREKREKNRILIIEKLSEFATQVKDSTGLRYVNWYQPSQQKEIIIPDDADTVKYFYKVSDYSIELYKEADHNSNTPAHDSEFQEKQKRIGEQRAALEEVTKRAYQLRKEFILGISNTMAKKKMAVIMEYSVRVMLGDYFNLDYDDITEVLNIEVGDEVEELGFEIIKEQVTAQPERHLLVVIYMAMESEREKYFNWNNQYSNNENLNDVYSLLERLGYEISDEERDLKEGTHGLFQQVGE